MRVILFILILLTFASCGHAPLSNRFPASFYNDVQYGDVEISQSSVKQFPPEIEAGLYRYFFYVQLKDEQGDYIDRDKNEFKVINPKNQEVKFSFERILRGRYYLIIEKSGSMRSSELDFYIAGIKLKENLKIKLQHASRNHSNLKMISHTHHQVKFLLTLNDHKGRAVNVPFAPEIILDGNVEIKDLKPVKDGQWEFTVLHSEQNLLLYFSVRTQGAYFKNLFRFHHVEK